MVSARSQIEGNVVETWSDGQKYITAFAHTQGYRDYPGLGWIIAVRKRRDIALVPARTLQWQVFVCGVGLGGLFAMWSWVRSRRLVEPITKLSYAADSIRQNHQPIPIPILTGKDELATLSSSLHYMVQALHNQQQALIQANHLQQKRPIYK
jgi:HAMP domain-containing protein